MCLFPPLLKKVMWLSEQCMHLMSSLANILYDKMAMSLLEVCVKHYVLHVECPP